MADAEAAAAVAKPSLVKKLLLPLIGALGLTGAALGGLHFAGIINFGGPEESTAVAAEGAEGETDAAGGPAMTAKAGEPAYFFTLHPDLLVNFTADGDPHYLKVGVDIMARDEDVIKGVEEYQSVLRNNLLMKFQQVEFNSLKRAEGMADMQALALAEIKSVMKR